MLKNVLLNLGGRLTPLLVGLLSMPIVIRGLGIERFGVLSLIWGIMTFLTVLDLGLGRAASHEISAVRGSGRYNAIPGIVASAAVTQLLIGVGIAAAILILAPIIVAAVFHAPGLLRAESETAVRLFALALPASLASLTLTGALEALDRFDLSSGVAIGTTSLTFLSAAMVAQFRPDLRLIAIALAVIQIARVLTLTGLYRLALPGLSTVARPPAPRMVRGLLHFGAWVTAAAVLNILVAYVDRFLIARILGVADVGRYAGPYDLISRMGVLPAGVVAVVFPLLSRTFSRNPEYFRKIQSRATHYLLLSMCIATSATAAYARELVAFYFGANATAASVTVLRVLSMGMLVNAPAYTALVALQAIGRPDIPAKLYAAELAATFPVLWWATVRFGIVGAAAVWTIRCSVDSAALHCLVARTATRAEVLPSRWVRRRAIALVVLPTAGLALGFVPTLLPAFKITVFASCTGLYCALCWKYLMSKEDRRSCRFWRPAEAGAAAARL